MIRKTMLLGCLAFLAWPSAPAFAAPDLAGSVEVEVVPVPNAEGKVPVNFYITLENKGDETCPTQWYADFWASFP